MMQWREIVMYLRFVVADIDENSQRELGAFHAVGNLRDDGKLHPHEEEQHDLIRDWFNDNLKKPMRFTASKPPFKRKKKKAISWFKDTAYEHLARVRSLVAILQDHGISVRMLKTERVGYVVYEDEYQIVAEPFAEDGRTRLIDKTLAHVDTRRRGFLNGLFVGAAVLASQPLLTSTVVAVQAKGKGKVGPISKPEKKGKGKDEIHRPPVNIHRRTVNK
jgi:hypothetical protein